MSRTSNLNYILATILILGLWLNAFGVIVWAEQNDDIYISEVNYAGSVNDLNCKKSEVSNISCANDKWIEIYNPSNNSVDLQGIKVGVGKRVEDPEKFASTFAISQSLVIKPMSYLVLLNSNRNMLSTLDLAGIKYNSFGSLFGISSNATGSKYLRVALIKDSKVLSERKIYDLDSLEKANNINQSVGGKRSIYYEARENIPKFSDLENSYFSNNFGTPGSFKVITGKDESTKVVENIPLVADLDIAVQPDLAPNLSNTELNTGITQVKVEGLNTETKLVESFQTPTETEIFVQPEPGKKLSSVSTDELNTILSPEENPGNQLNLVNNLNQAPFVNISLEPEVATKLNSVTEAQIESVADPLTVKNVVTSKAVETSAAVYPELKTNVNPLVNSQLNSIPSNTNYNEVRQVATSNSNYLPVKSYNFKLTDLVTSSSNPKEINNFNISKIDVVDVNLQQEVIQREFNLNNPQNVIANSQFHENEILYPLSESEYLKKQIHNATTYMLYLFAVSILLLKFWFDDIELLKTLHLFGLTKKVDLRFTSIK